MKRYEVVPYRFHRHIASGRKVSIFGAVPWVSSADKANWETVSEGFTWADNKDNTVGCCRRPVADRAEADKTCATMNAWWESIVGVDGNVY